VRYYAKAIEYAPNDPVLYLVLSDALFATGDYHYAAYALRRALDIDPAAARFVIDKRAFYGNSDDFARQLETLERYLQDHYLDDDARLVLAANYLFGARPADCAKLLEDPLSQSVRDSGAGRLLLEAAHAELATPKPAPKPAPELAPEPK
jgi:tetratricopeptide (TPR) repeat protein